MSNARLYENLAAEIESEYNAGYDYLEEAYGPTRDDAALCGIEDILAECSSDTALFDEYRAERDRLRAKLGLS